MEYPRIHTVTPSTAGVTLPRSVHLNLPFLRLEPVLPLPTGQSGPIQGLKALFWSFVFCFLVMSTLAQLGATGKFGRIWGEVRRANAKAEIGSRRKV